MINKFPFFQAWELNDVLFFRQGMQYRDVEYNTANIALLSINQITDILYVSDSDRYIKKERKANDCLNVIARTDSAELAMPILWYLKFNFTFQLT